MKIKSYKFKIMLTFISVFLSLSLHVSTQNEYLLSFSNSPHSLEFLPKPPSYQSVSFLRDQADYHKGYALKNTERWDIAKKDANLSSVQALANRFSTAFGYEISKEQTPYTYRIIAEILHDNGFIVNDAKQHYMRVRPFVFFHQESCTPESEKFLRKNGSYPSGHTTVGWSTALALSQINPSRANEILRRGYEYGQSRVICGAHWQSDVDAGRITRAALFARLDSNHVFLSWIKKAQDKIKTKNKPTPTLAIID